LEQVPAIVAAIAFLAALDRLGVVREARSAIETSRGATAVVRDASLSDEHKERRLREASVSLLGVFVSLLLRGSAALALATVVLIGFELFGWSTLAEASRWLMSWPAILGFTAVAVFASTLRRRG
jgi:hypothetical protein